MPNTSDCPKVIVETVQRHKTELRKLCDAREISVNDHDTIGLFMCGMSFGGIGALIDLSDRAWEEFKRIVNESREQHYSQVITRN